MLRPISRRSSPVDHPPLHSLGPTAMVRATSLSNRAQHDPIGIQPAPLAAFFFFPHASHCLALLFISGLPRDRSVPRRFSTAMRKHCLCKRSHVPVPTNAAAGTAAETAIGRKTVPAKARAAALHRASRERARIRKRCPKRAAQQTSDVEEKSPCRSRPSYVRLVAVCAQSHHVDSSSDPIARKHNSGAKAKKKEQSLCNNWNKKRAA